VTVGSIKYLNFHGKNSFFIVYEKAVLVKAAPSEKKKNLEFGIREAALLLCCSCRYQPCHLLPQGQQEALGVESNRYERNFFKKFMQFL
jgi:hypothetical protein